jgi:uncharacterized paraquat-inducible protein A
MDFWTAVTSSTQIVVRCPRCHHRWMIAVLRAVQGFRCPRCRGLVTGESKRKGK